MPAFDFRDRLGGGQPTVRSFAIKTAGMLTHGDMLSLEGGRRWGGEPPPPAA